MSVYSIVKRKMKKKKKKFQFASLPLMATVQIGISPIEIKKIITVSSLLYTFYVIYSSFRFLFSFEINFQKKKKKKKLQFRVSLELPQQCLSLYPARTQARSTQVKSNLFNLKVKWNSIFIRHFV